MNKKAKVTEELSESDDEDFDDNAQLEVDSDEEDKVAIDDEAEGESDDEIAADEDLEDEGDDEDSEAEVEGAQLDFEDEGDDEDAEGDDEGDDESDDEPASKKPTEVKELFVGNLAYEVDEKMLNEFFGEFAEVVRSRVVLKNGRSRGIAFVEFKSHKDAKAALEGGNEKELAGRPIRAKFNDDRPEKKTNEKHQEPVESSTTVFVGNLNFNTQKTDLWEFFEKYGTLKDVRLADDGQGKCRGFAHIEFETAEAAKKALGANGESIDDREIKVNLSAPKKEGSNGGGRGGFRGRGDRGRGGFRGDRRGGGRGFRGDRGGFRGDRRGRGDRGGFRSRGGFGAEKREFSGERREFSGERRGFGGGRGDRGGRGGRGGFRGERRGGFGDRGGRGGFGGGRGGFRGGRGGQRGRGFSKNRGD